MLTKHLQVQAQSFAFINEGIFPATKYFIESLAHTISKQKTDSGDKPRNFENHFDENGS